MSSSIDDAPSPPVLVLPPDLSPHGSGTGAIPFVWTFEAARPGPHVAVVACIHGNEICGAHALDALLRDRVRPIRGTMSLVLANVGAFQAFDPEDPFATRFLDEDMNRVWTPDRLEGSGTSRELDRARELRPLFDTVDALLDLHSMHTLAPPLAMAGRRSRGVALATRVGWPETVVVDQGHADGVRLRDYAHFDAPEGQGRAVLVECGQHWEAGVDRAAIDVAWRFLRAEGVMEADSGPAAVASGAPPVVVEVVDRVDLGPEPYAFVAPFQGGEMLDQGAPILQQGGRVVRAPFDGCVLIMPTTGLREGQTAVRLGRRVKGDPLPG